MIPTSPDVRTLVGDFAEQVDNRSLLYEKFSLPKVWGQAEGRKLNEAARWSILRIVWRGGELLAGDAKALESRASRRNVQPHNTERMRHEARVASKMATVAKPDSVLAQAATDNARNLLAALARSYEGRVVTFEATLGGRLLVNLAGGVVENAGICLDRCFGLPFLPGSAVKGIARSQALSEIRQTKGTEKTRMLAGATALFGFGQQDIARDGVFAWAASDARPARDMAAAMGGKDFKGVASFLPAYPTSVPRLVVDMVNPHYPDYYRGKRPKATDDENPVPNYFPAVEKGASFGFAVLLNRIPECGGFTAEELLRLARGWVERAITRKGAGAKTAAGYGWFMLGPPPKGEQAPTVIPANSGEREPAPVSPADAFIRKWRGGLSTKSNFVVALPELVAIADDEDLKRAFETVIPDAERRRLRRNNPYWQAFTNGKHAEAGRSILQRLRLELN